MADLPKSIRVGYRDYAVEDWPVHLASANNELGNFDKDNGIIRVASGYPDQVRAETLLHEVLHGAYKMGCLDTGADEEKIVSVLANQLTQVWRDNPGFISFMSESLKG